MEDSGITDIILIDGEALGSGSFKGFLHGKHYSHFKRLHPNIFLALRYLQLKEFLANTPHQKLSVMQFSNFPKIKDVMYWKK